jgi:hypothetical protein
MPAAAASRVASVTQTRAPFSASLSSTVPEQVRWVKAVSGGGEGPKGFPREKGQERWGGLQAFERGFRKRPCQAI